MKAIAADVFETLPDGSYRHEGLLARANRESLKGVRRFEFDGRPGFSQIMRAIVAALAEEGLALNDSNTPDRVTTVIVGERKVAIVPLSRIGRNA